jgi:hypothetical protein
MTLTDTMSNADFVLINGIVYETEYLRVPDEDMVADDVVLEAKHGELEVAFTLADLDGAQHLGEGVYRLLDGHQLRFLSTATVH